MIQFGLVVSIQIRSAQVFGCLLPQARQAVTFMGAMNQKYGDFTPKMEGENNGKPY